MIIKFTKKYLIYIMLFIPFLKPESLVVSDTATNIFSLWRVISALIVISVYIIKIIPNHPYSLSIIIIIYEVMLFLNSYCRYGKNCDFDNLVVQVLSVIVITMLFEIGMRKNPKDFMNAICTYGLIICSITCITMFLFYPEGMTSVTDNYYLLGNDNASYFSIYVIEVIGIIRDKCFKNKISCTTVLLYILTLCAFIYTLSMAAIFVQIMLGLSIFILQKNRIKKINPFVFILTTIIISVGLVIFRIDRIFQAFLININKGANLNGRGGIWKNAVDYIKESPILGYGHENVDVFYRKFWFDHLHNIFLDVTYTMGIVGFVMFIIIFILIANKINKINSVSLHNISLLTIVLFLFLSMFDYYNSRYLIFGLYITIYSIDRIQMDNYRRAYIK